MKLSDQVCTREQAQRLKELGVDGDSLFAWEQSGLPGEWRVTYPFEYARETKALYPAEIKWILAWTAGELGIALPATPIPDGGISYSWYHRNNWRGHSVGYSAPGQSSNHIERGWFTNEAEARADLLIYLLENNLVKVEDVNNRLKQ